MKIIDKFKEWWNKPSLTEQLNEDWNAYEKWKNERIKSYENMTERELLIEIAKNTLESR